VTDFTNRDKTHILDLFVNNEKTLLKIYEALFPHRANQAVNTNSQIGGMPSHMMNDPMGIYNNQSQKSSQQFGNHSSMHGSYNGPLGSHPMAVTYQNQAILNSLGNPPQMMNQGVNNS